MIKSLRNQRFIIAPLLPKIIAKDCARCFRNRFKLTHSPFFLYYIIQFFWNRDQNPIHCHWLLLISIITFINVTCVTQINARNRNSQPDWLTEQSICKHSLKKLTYKVKSLSNHDKWYTVVLVLVRAPFMVVWTWCVFDFFWYPWEYVVTYPMTFL